MSTKILKWGLLAIVLIVFAVLFFQRTRQSSNQTALIKAADTQATVGVPVSIKIPAIGVDAVIEQVGITGGGLMDVPKLPLDAAWYQLGPRPGQTGSAVIDGHVDWKNGAKAVFLDLHNLKTGDKIFAQDSQGAVITFVVSFSRIYKADASAVDIFTSNDGKAHLNLITCQGVWSNAAQSYPDRLVVFADKETE